MKKEPEKEEKEVKYKWYQNVIDKVHYEIDPEQTCEYLEKVDYTPIYVLDNGNKAENRFELTDMKQLALDYANGDTSRITRKTYDQLVKKLENLQRIVNNK